MTQQATDDVLDVFDVLVRENLIRRAERESAKTRLQSLPRLSRASITVATGLKTVLGQLRESGQSLNADAVWAALEAAVGQTQLTDALNAVEELTVDQGDPDAAARAELLDRFPTIRKAVASLVEVPSGAAEGGSEVLAEFGRLPQLFPARCRKLSTAQISSELVGSSWRRLMLGNPDPAADQVDQRAYISAVTETFHSRLRRGDVFACGGLRWADPRAKLLDAQQWQTAKHDVLTSLELPEDPQPHLTELTGKLDTAYRVVADRAEDGEEQPATVGADGRLHLDKPDPREVSDEQTELSRVCAAMLPQIDLPDLIMEVHGWTGCLDEYTHLSEADARMSELPTSVAACLVAEACNVGFTPVIQPGHSALSRSRLSHVQQNYLRPDTHRAANARLPENQADIDLVSQWGTGAVASLMRITQGGGSPTTLGKALAEYGRIAKTLHMLAFVDADETYRRRIHTQLNTQESRHALARQIFHGKRGQLYQPYRQGQEDQLGALGLVLNMVALWNTVYLDAIINHLRSQGYPVRDEDLARLSPLGWRHINLQGRYAFISSPPSELRPLRDPDDEL